VSEVKSGSRRVLVVLSAIGSPPQGLLDAGAALARGVAAELAGLFVEDEELLRLVALPVARVVGYPSAAPRAVDFEAMARALRAAGERAAAALRAAAERENVPSSFQITRGRVTAEVAAASMEADLVLLGRGAHPAEWSGMTKTARAVAERSRRPVVLVGAGRSIGPPAVLYDASPTGERALAARRAHRARHRGARGRARHR
jgi:hypothetical protein